MSGKGHGRYEKNGEFRYGLCYASWQIDIVELDDDIYDYIYIWTGLALVMWCYPDRDCIVSATLGRQEQDDAVSVLVADRVKTLRFHVVVMQAWSTLF